MKSQEAEINYSTYLNSVSEPVITTNLNGLITSCNKAAEELLGLKLNFLHMKRVSDFLFLAKGSPQIEELISQLKAGDKLSKHFTTKTGKDSHYELDVIISALLDSEFLITGTILRFKEKFANAALLNIEKVSFLLTQLNDNYQDNITKITALCGELLDATCALYNRIDSNILCSLGQWNTPTDFNPINSPEGHICYDVIKQAKNEIYYVPHLASTSYSSTDKNVLEYGLKTYIGQQVSCNGEPVGSLCVVYNTDVLYSETNNYILRLLAIAMEVVETRESLRRSHNKFEGLFNYANEGIIFFSQNLIITDVNQDLITITGFSKEELVGKKITEVLFTGESVNLNPLDIESLQKGKAIIKEREIECKNGKIIAVEMQSRQTSDNNFQTIIFDMTERKEAESKLKLSENTYSEIINSLFDAVYILDKDACFIYVNSASERMYKYKKEEFIGRTPEFISAPDKNDMAQTIQFIKDAYDGENKRFEYWGRRKDGSEFPKEVSLSPGFWFGEKVVIALGIDITKRKAAEENLLVSEEKYRLLVQYSSDPIFSYNPDDTYRFVNEAFAFQFGKKPEELIGKTPYEIFSKDEADKRLALIHKVFATAQKGEIEVKVVNVKSEINYYLTLADPIIDQKGKVLWVTCISKDITLRRQAEEELRQKNEQLKATNAEKDKFFSIVAHDLRGPMNGFLGLTSIMAEDIESLSVEELKEIANTMRTSAVNIYRLIENLLEWSRLQRGVVNFEPQTMFLKSSLNKSLELIKDAAEKKDITLQINIPEHMVVNVDLHMLETVIRNLLSNAIKFSFRGGHIRIDAKKTDNRMISIEITDNGIGIPADIQSKLFSISESTSRKGTENEPSTGLGLILCNEFVEKQGGKIEVESIEGNGSTFKFTVQQL